MYVIRTFRNGDYANSTLCEMTAAELREAVAEAADEAAKDNPRFYDYKRVGADRARAWVDSGRIHETGLYRDYDGRIRYARGES